jgi:type I restriction enzyme S subunit
VSRIEDLLAKLCPNGVPLKELGELGEFIRGRRFTKKDYVDSGLGAIHYGEIYTNYGLATAITRSFVSPELKSSLRLARPGDLIIAATGENLKDVCKAVAWIGDQEIAIHDDSYIFRHGLNPEYVSYFFQSSDFQDQKVKFASESKVVRVSGANMAKIKMPVPPPEVQREIVRVLNTFTELEVELEAELEARRTQYAVYQESLLSFSKSGARWMTLGEIGKVAMCRRVFKNETSPAGEIPFYKIGTFGADPDSYISRDLYESYRALYSFPQPGDVLLSAAGTIGRAIPYDGRPAYFQDSNIVWIANDESIVTNAYLSYWYRVIKWTTDGGTIRRLYNENIRRARIAVPSLAEQERIVAILEKFDALVNDLSIGLPAELKTRRQQYEHYRDRLLTFSEAV